MSEITVRPYQLSDVDDFMKWACNSEVLKFLKLQLWINASSSRQQVTNFFKEVVIPHQWYYAICLDGRAIGQIVLERQDGDFGLDRGRGTLSCALGREYWGRDIGPTALRMFLRIAFETIPNLVRLQGYVEMENKASERMLEKVGFRNEGVLRQYLMLGDGVSIDVKMFSILSTDPILKCSRLTASL